jgi:hypothetical protein
MTELISRTDLGASPSQSASIVAVKAFGELQAGIRNRCDQPPVQQAPTEVGSYHLFTG